MAYTIHQYPVNSADKVPAITNWTPMVGYMLYQSDISGTFFYQLVCTIQQVDSAGAVLNTLGILKQRRNGYSPDVAGQRARAFFDLKGILNSQLVDTVYDQNLDGLPFDTIHKLGANNYDTDSYIYSKNGDTSQGKLQYITIKITGSEWYSTTATGMPESQGSTVTDTKTYLSASLPLLTPRDTDSEYIQGTAFTSYRMVGATNKFLSDLEPQLTEISATELPRSFVQESDYATLGFINDFSNCSSDLDWFKIVYYDNTNSSIGNAQFIANTSANGGLPPNDASIEDTHRLLYVGCGPANLQASNVPAFSSAGTVDGGAKPSNFSDWDYYLVTGVNASFSPVSKSYLFKRSYNNCKGYKTRRLAFRNSLGCYDYFNFSMKSVQKVDITRNDYNTMLGTFNKSRYRYNDTQRGKRTRQTVAILKETLQTDWITETDARLLEKLIYSTNVEIIENIDTPFTQGVIISDSSFIRKTQANDKLIQYTVEIEYANPINTNS